MRLDELHEDLLNEYDRLADDALLQKIDESAAIRELETQEGWKLIAAGCRRLASWAQEALVSVPADQQTKIIELQQIVKLYRNVIPSMKNSLKDEGKLAFREAKRRGVIEKVLSLVKP
jgi:hypothetical protein